MTQATLRQRAALALSLVSGLGLYACGAGMSPDTTAPHEVHAEEAAGGVADGSAPADADVAVQPAPPAAQRQALGGTTATMAAELEDSGADEPGAPAAQSWRRVNGAARFATVSLGGGQSLELKKVRVSVQVEGIRARTVVDHIFYNPHARTLEGTFRYPLPPEATVSSYAMYLGTGRGEPRFFGPDAALRAREEAMQQDPLQATIARVDPQQWGELRVGRIVRAERGREVYENVTRRQIDPALVEEVAPNTFEARVFPIQANGFHRVIVSYEQTLPRIGDELEYLFPLPEGHVDSFELDVAARADLTRSLRYTGDLRGGQAVQRQGQHVYALRTEGAQRGTLSFRMRPRDTGPVEVLASRAPGGRSHFLLRLRGDERVGGSRAAAAPQALFLIDTSLSEHPDRFNLDVRLMREILAANAGIQRFNVITFDAGARWLSQEWIANDGPGREHATNLLEDILLEGATDLGAALDVLSSPPMQMQQSRADVFLLTDGALSWGERDPGTLLSRFEASSPWDARVFAYRTGLGAEDVALMRRLTARGAVFNCLSRSALPACATAHRRTGMQIERVTVEGGGSGARTSDVLVAGGAATFTPGAELLLAGKIDRPGPATIRIEGTVGGQRTTWTQPVTLEPRGELASRAWAEIAVAHLLATHDAELEDLAVALGQHYRVPSRATSFLVLETDAEYEQYALEEAWQDAGGAPVAELVTRTTQRRGTARTSWERLERALRAGSHHHGLLRLEDGDVYQQLSRFVARAPVDFLRGRQAIPAVLEDDVPRRYRNGRSTEADALETYRGEGERRWERGQRGAAIRALSSAIENAPASAEVARSVGYTLMAWGADAEAAEIFLGVLERRPYEPQSYRDLASALWTQRPSLSALLYEAALSGDWDGRFHGVTTVIREEYALFSRAWRRRSPTSPLARWLAEREQALGLRVDEAAMRVTMTWNTDNTDIDLWVTDPSGEKCYYAHRDLQSGGRLLDDVTRGFGPERFMTPQAPSGEYLIQAHYYGNNGNRLLAETYVTLTVATHVGTAQEQIRRHVVRLNDRGDVADVARVRVR